MMTTTNTFTATEDGSSSFFTQAQTLVPLAIAIAFGMMASTVLILIVIPCINVILCDLRLIMATEDVHTQGDI